MSDSKPKKQQQMPFSLRIPPKLRAEFEEYCKTQEITLTQGILDAMKKAIE